MRRKNSGFCGRYVFVNTTLGCKDIPQLLSNSNDILPWASTCYLLFIIGNIPLKLGEGLRKLTQSRTLQEALWPSAHTGHLLTCSLTVQALSGGFSAACIPCLGPQCLQWLEPQFLAPGPPTSPAPQLAIFLWDRGISLVTTKKQKLYYLKVHMTPGDQTIILLFPDSRTALFSWKGRGAA